jgi:hypothetical protein
MALQIFQNRGKYHFQYNALSIKPILSQQKLAATTSCKTDIFLR